MSLQQSANVAWTGADFAGHRDWIITLEPEHRRELEQAVASLRHRQIALHDATRADFKLPLLEPVLNEAARELRSGRGFVFIRGLPLADLSTEEAGTLFWGLGSFLGMTVSQSTAGDRLGHVMDKGSKERYYTAGGPLVFHTDPVDVVGLLCLQSAKQGGASRVVNARALYNILNEEEPGVLEILCRGFYNSRRGHGESTTPDRVPVFAEGEEGLESYLLPLTITQAEEEGFALSSPERKALQIFDEVASRPGVYLDMDFQPGDIQFLNNRFLFHARTDFEDFPDPALKRHLLRLWLMMPDWPLRFPAMDIHGKTDRHGGGVKPSGEVEA